MARKCAPVDPRTIYLLSIKRQGKLEWMTEVEANGHMWSSPGPSVQQSLLLSLPRKISYVYWPEALYESTTFTELD